MGPLTLEDQDVILLKHILPVCCLGLLSGNLKLLKFIVRLDQLLNSKDGVVKTNTFQGRVQKTEVIFRGESYNVTSGCPSKNPEVLRSSFSHSFTVL